MWLILVCVAVHSTIGYFLQRWIGKGGLPWQQRLFITVAWLPYITMILTMMLISYIYWKIWLMWWSRVCWRRLKQERKTQEALRKIV